MFWQCFAVIAFALAVFVAVLWRLAVMDLRTARESAESYRVRWLQMMSADDQHADRAG